MGKQNVLSAGGGWLSFLGLWKSQQKWTFAIRGKQLLVQMQYTVQKSPQENSWTFQVEQELRSCDKDVGGGKRPWSGMWRRPLEGCLLKYVASGLMSSRQQEEGGVSKWVVNDITFVWIATRPRTFHQTFSSDLHFLLYYKNPTDD